MKEITTHTTTKESVEDFIKNPNQGISFDKWGEKVYNLVKDKHYNFSEYELLLDYEMGLSPDEHVITKIK
jgi:hypothetical protein